MRKFGSLLYDSPPLVVNPEIACIFGLEAALVLQYLHSQIYNKQKEKKKDSFINGYYWVQISITELGKQFIFISEKAIKRIFKKLKDEGIIFVEQLHKSKQNHTNFYTINYAILENQRGTLYNV